MNIEFRIAQLERLLSDVSARRSRVRSVVPELPSPETTAAGWNRLEHGFRSALNSLKLQRDGTETAVKGWCA